MKDNKELIFDLCITISKYRDKQTKHLEIEKYVKDVICELSKEIDSRFVPCGNAEDVVEYLKELSNN